MLIDSHCHLDYDPLCKELDTVVHRAKENRVDYMLTISTEDKKFQNILDIVNKYEQVYGTYGIHPHEAKNHKHISLETILKNCKNNKKIIGIGETGLDFYYNNSEKKQQLELFEKHIFASQKLNVPIIVHTRSAEEETYNILKKAKNTGNLKILIHCFTGTKKFAHKLLDLNSFISASGIVTFKKSTELADTFKSIPEKNILVETDSPYLSPEPLRGKSNEPSHIVHTAKFLAALKNINFAEFSKTTTSNFFNLFGKLE